MTENQQEKALFSEGIKENKNFSSMNQQENAPFSEENEDESENSSSMTSSNEEFLAELNLVLILSSLYCPEENMDFEETKETKQVKEQRAKHVRSGLRKNARGLSEFRAAGRQQTSRFQQKMVDCRHSRRM